MPPRVSFVIPAFNEERLIGATLEAVHRAAQAVGGPYELVVADDNSTDRTADVAERHGARVVAVSKRHIAATRNAGARASSGDRLVFVDADTLIDETVLGATLRAFAEGAVGGGAAVRLEEPVPAYARLLMPALCTMFRWSRLAAGCFVFCTRPAFERSGGFDESLFAAEEIAFSRALGRLGRFVVLREPVVTSGRKLRTFSAWEVAGTFGRLAVVGRRGLRSRQHLGMWYGARRQDER